MALISMTLSDLEGHFRCLKPFWFHTSESERAIQLCRYKTKCRVDAEVCWGTYQAMGSRIRCNGNVSETVQDSDVVTMKC